MSLLPTSTEIESLLDIPSGSEIERILKEKLLGPIEGFVSHPGKRFRSALIEIGWGLASPDSQLDGPSPQISELIELIHSASLIIDDVQDGSLKRRGRASLQVSLGGPSAFNAGSWLLFWALFRLDQAGLSSKISGRMKGLVIEMITRAHFGQALDLSVSVPKVEQFKVRDLCLESMRLKTGTITALSLECGALQAGAGEELLNSLRLFAYRFGTALQMFDDLGSLRPDHEKRYEDLIHGRPGWTFAFAASEFSAEEYQQFLGCIERLPEDEYLRQWLTRHRFVERARLVARNFHDEALGSLSAILPSTPSVDRGLKQIQALFERVAHSY